MAIYEILDLISSDICINLLGSNRKGIFDVNNIPDILLDKEIQKLYVDNKYNVVCIDINWTTMSEKIKFENYLLLNK